MTFQQRALKNRRLNPSLTIREQQAELEAAEASLMSYQQGMNAANEWAWDHSLMGMTFNWMARWIARLP